MALQYKGVAAYGLEQGLFLATWEEINRCGQYREWKSFGETMLTTVRVGTDDTIPEMTSPYPFASVVARCEGLS